MLKTSLNPTTLPRILVVLGSVCFLQACSKPVESVAPVRPVKVMTVGQAEGIGSQTLSGEIRSRMETVLAFRVPGKVLTRTVQLGETVQAGQVLAQLDVADAQLNTDAAAAQAKLAESEVIRFRELRAKNFVSQSALDAKETAFQAAKAQAGVVSHQRDYTHLRADQAGVVAGLLAEVGQFVAAGQPVVRLARADQPEVALSVSEADITHWKTGMPATVRLWADSTASYSAKVREIAAVAESPARTFAVRVSIDRPDARLRLGQTADVMLAATNKTGGIQVPLTAIFQQGDQPAVWVLATAGQAATVQLRPVKVLCWLEQGAQVSEGLQAGEQIVVAGVHKLTAGEAVKPVPVEQKAGVSQP